MVNKSAQCITFLIVPAFSDQAGQCRIVQREHHRDLRPGLSNYRLSPQHWDEAGLMSSTGELRCLDVPASVFQSMKNNQPLMAGTTYTYDADWSPV